MSSFMKCALWSAAIGFASPCALGDVLTVGSSNSAYADIPSALAVAVDGDVLLVRAGYYSGFAIDGKAVSIIADAGAAVTVGGQAEVRNLPAGKSVVLAGLAINNSGDSSLLLENNAGRVRIESVTATAPAYVFSSDWFAAEVNQCADISFVDCTLVGRRGEWGGFGYGHGGEPAIYADGSTVTLYDCTATGGIGLQGHYGGQFPAAGSPGAAAFHGFNSVLFARGCTLTGGAGGAGLNGGVPPPTCTTPYSYPTAGGHGGAGVTLQGALSSGRLVATAAVGGVGGIGGMDPCGNQIPQSPSGQPFYDPLGVITTKFGPAISLAVPQPAREGQNVTLHVEGPPGFSALLLIGNGGPGYANLPDLGGVLLVQAPLRRLMLGTIPPSGVLDVNLPVPDLGTGVEALLVHTQAIFINTSGRSLLSSPGVVVMLDSSF